MTDATPLSDLDGAIEALDFASARSIIADADSDSRPSLEARLKEAMADAEDRAEQLAGRIQSMARADHYEGLLALAEEPTTDQLLQLLSPEIRRGATLHLDGARRRQERFQEAAEKHMSEAAQALVLLDTTRARSELDRVDRRWLNETQRHELEALLAQVEEAAAERRELDARTAEVLRDHHPSQSGERGQPHATERRRPGAGCLGSALAILGSTVVLMALRR